MKATIAITDLSTFTRVTWKIKPRNLRALWEFVDISLENLSIKKTKIEITLED